MNQPSDMPPRLFYGYIIAFAGLIIMTSMFSTRFVFGVFFKPVLADFGWTRATTSFAFSLSMIMEGLIGIVMGGLNDRFGPRMVLSLCGALVGIGCLLMSKISALWQLYLFFGIIMGSGMSGVWVPLTGMVARWFVWRRGVMTGFVLTGAGLGALIAPPLANWLITVYDWRNAFRIMGIPVLVIVLLAAQFLRGDPSQMGLTPYGSEKIEKSGLNSHENREDFHFKEAFLVRQFWLVMFMLFCFGFCSFVVIVHIVPYATDIKMSAVNAARVLAAMGGITIIGRLFLGNLADKIGSRGVFIIGFIAMMASFCWLVPARDLWMLYLFSMVFGFVQGGMGSCESLLVADIFGLRSHGLIYGAIACGFTGGAAAGPWLAGYLFDITGSYQSAFITCAVIGIVGLVLTILIKPIATGQTAHEQSL